MKRFGVLGAALAFSAGGASFWLPYLAVRVLGSPAREAAGALASAAAVAAWLLLRRAFPDAPGASAGWMLAGVAALGYPITLLLAFLVGLAVDPAGAGAVGAYVRGVPLSRQLLWVYEQALGGLALVALALAGCVVSGARKRGAAALLALLTAFPASSWAGLKTVAAPVKGVSVPGVSVSLPQVSIPSIPSAPAVGSIAVPAISLPTAEVKFVKMQSIPAAAQRVLPGAVRPAPLAPAQSPVAPIMERLIQPMGEWARPEAQGGKQEAAADFERRAFGAPNETPSTGSDAPSAGANEDKNGDGLPRSARRPGPHVMLLVEVSDAPGAREAALAKLEKEYGFRLDHGFPPVADGVTAHVRGLLPLEELQRFVQDADVVRVLPAAGRIDNFSPEAYKVPETRENAFRWGLRRLLEKAELAGILLTAPFQIGVLLVFGPLVAALSVPAALAPVSWALLAGGVATLASVTPLQVLLKRLPPMLRFSIGPAFQAAAGVWLALHAMPAFGAWAAVNAALAAVAAARVILPLKSRRLSHERDRTLQSAELAALISGLSAGLTALGAAAAGSLAWATGLGLFATVTLALLALPGLKRSASPSPAAAPEAPKDAWLAAALEFGRAKRDAQAKEKRRGRLVYASAAAMVLLPLSSAGAMKAVLLGWWGIPTLMAIGAALVAAGVGLMAAYLRAWIRASKAYARLERAAAGVNRAAGARDGSEARRALQDAEALANAVFAVEALAPQLGPLAASLRRGQAQLDGGELRALEALERILAGRDLRGDRGLSAQLASDGRAAILARRRLLWDDESLSAKDAAAEDSALDALARRFAREANLADDADKDFQFVADRLDRLYETEGPLSERHVALALSAAGAFKWAEFGRGRTTAGKRVMVLEALLKRQARNEETESEKRKAQARAVLESIVSAFDADRY